MFKQFITKDEQIYNAQYLGIQGIWGIGTHSFACLTNRRVADISIGRFSELTYQEGYLEFINSGVLFQPSKLGLYLLVGLWIFFVFSMSISIYNTLWWGFGAGTAFLLTIFFCSLLLLLLPFIIKAYYRIVKCGLVFWVKEGVPIYMFSNRKHLKRANMFFRDVTVSRETRIKQLGTVFN